MTTRGVIQLLLNREFTWNRVNDQPCIHTFYKQFYINLCAWQRDGKRVISIDVDDINSGQHDIVNSNIKEGEEHFELLMDIYIKSWEAATNIATAE